MLHDRTALLEQIRYRPSSGIPDRHRKFRDTHRKSEAAGPNASVSHPKRIAQRLDQKHPWRT